MSIYQACSIQKEISICKDASVPTLGREGCSKIQEALTNLNLTCVYATFPGHFLIIYLLC
jgi:hypothetical protein